MHASVPAASHIRPASEIDRAAAALKQAIAGRQADLRLRQWRLGGDRQSSDLRLLEGHRHRYRRCAPGVVSLSATVELITAIANDIDYAEIFAYQLRNAARPGDVLITISSSGNSENIVRALAWARDNGLTTIAMSGFSGGRSATTADINLHVAAANYGVVEDAHQSLMHILAQYVRHVRNPAEQVCRRCVSEPSSGRKPAARP